MPLFRVIALYLVLFFPSAALAGPWLRAAGETFLSFSIETDLGSGLTDGSGFYGTLYAEHGLSERLTIGLDAGSTDEDVAKTILFFRWPLGATDRTTRIAAEFGLGMARETLALRPGLSVGRGLKAGQIPGWLSIDSRAVLLEGFDGLLETDFTFGLKPSRRDMIVLQMQTGLPWEGDAYAKFAPSYVRRIGANRHVELGLVAGVAEADDFKLKIGFWQEF